jgi:adenylate cyclase
MALPLLAALPTPAGMPLSPLLAGLDALLESAAFRLRGTRPAPADPVIVAIDSDSLSLAELLDPRERRASPLWRQMGAWPWPRALQAELAALVLERGAARVVFNVVQAGPSRYGPGDDEAFRRRLAPWRERLVLAAALSIQASGGVEQARLRQARAAVPKGAKAGASSVGLTNLVQSPQGLTEAIPGRSWLAAQLEGFPPPLPRPLAFAAAGASPPAGPLGIDYPGPAGTIRRVSAWRLLEPPASFWRGRTVLIGATAAELGDQQETPFGPQSGTDVQAAALATVLGGTGRQRLEDPLTALLALGWAVLVGLALGRCGTSGRSLATMAAAAAAVLLAWGVAWSAGGLRLPAAALLLPALAGGAVRAGGQGLREQRERLYLHQVLARRISPTLLQAILRDPGPIGTEVGGRRTRCVVLFADLVGFTTLSASLEPGPLFALLNRYFEAMAGAVLDEQGLLDKFIGDAVMAEFGVPRSRGDRQEAEAAVRAALAMQERLAALNRKLEAEGLPVLRQGIALHMGEVIAGNLGSRQRLEYTVIGAAVNVTSRLEGLTRRFPDHPVLITAELRALLPADLPVEDLGSHDLRGWPRPVAVFGLRGRA